MTKQLNALCSFQNSLLVCVLTRDAVEVALKEYTTFTVGNLGVFKCDRMPYGLCNAPVTFQWLMQNCMGELNLIYCLIYLDDLIVFSQMEEEHLH